MPLIVLPEPVVRRGMTMSAARSAALALTSADTRDAGCGERMITFSQALSAAKSTFRPGSDLVWPLPAVGSVSMKMKTICVAKPPPMPHGSARRSFTVTLKSGLSPAVTSNCTRSNEPGVYTASVG